MKDYVEMSFDQLPSIMEFLRGLLTQEGPVIVYTHCEVRERERGGGGRGEEGRGGRKGGGEGEEGRKVVVVCIHCEVSG